MEWSSDFSWSNCEKKEIKIKYETDWEGKNIKDRKGHPIRKGRATWWEKFGTGDSS